MPCVLAQAAAARRNEPIFPASTQGVTLSNNSDIKQSAKHGMVTAPRTASLSTNSKGSVTTCDGRIESVSTNPSRILASTAKRLTVERENVNSAKHQLSPSACGIAAGVDAPLCNRGSAAAVHGAPSAGGLLAGGYDGQRAARDEVGASINLPAEVEVLEALLRCSRQYTDRSYHVIRRTGGRLWHEGRTTCFCDGESGKS